MTAQQKSFETGIPVRVIRGYELDSEFAPWEGFRYDGLYICKRVTLFCISIYIRDH
jgi:E3 ubiquitin-protein ligase UHRF1